MYYFYKKLTLTEKSNKNGKGTSKVEFFYYRKSNPCGVLTACIETTKSVIKKQQTGKESHILIVDVSINDSEYILMNLYNTEK